MMHGCGFKIYTKNYRSTIEPLYDILQLLSSASIFHMLIVYNWMYYFLSRNPLRYLSIL